MGTSEHENKIKREEKLNKKSQNERTKKPIKENKKGNTRNKKTRARKSVQTIKKEHKKPFKKN